MLAGPADDCEVGTRPIIGATRPVLNPGFKLFYRTVPRGHMADEERQEAVVKASGLDWTLVQRVGLTNGPATENWLADPSGRVRRRPMSRADVAALLVALAGDGHASRAAVALSG